MIGLIDIISNFLQDSSFSTMSITIPLLFVVIAIFSIAILQANEIKFTIKDFIEIIVKK